MVPYTPQHILRLEKEGKFPRRVQVGPNRVAWLEGCSQNGCGAEA
jgi:prophage regulatory protein